MNVEILSCAIWQDTALALRRAANERKVHGRSVVFDPGAGVNIDECERRHFSGPSDHREEETCVGVCGSFCVGAVAQ